VLPIVKKTVSDGLRGLAEYWFGPSFTGLFVTSLIES